MDMSNDILERLQNFEVEHCHECSVGVYKPVEGVKQEHCYTFFCDKCGAILSFTPYLDLKAIRKKHLAEHSTQNDASSNK